MIWAGSNDGLVHVTRDDGKTWTNVTPAGLLPGGRVQNIEPSPKRAGSAYVAIYRYLLGDFAPYLYRDRRLREDLDKDREGHCRRRADAEWVREDPDRAGLLYAGTEFGMYISFNNGEEWKPFQLNLPRTPVTDIRVAHKDLVLSTQGRGFYIVDNITSLHYPKTFDSVTLLQPREAIRTPSRGRNNGAQIEYYLPIAANEVKLEILDKSGKLVRGFTTAAAAVAEAGGGAGDDDEEGGGFRQRGPVVRLEKTPGLHRFVWDLRYNGPYPSLANGPVAVPGAYSVKLTAGTTVTTQPLTVAEDSRVTADGVTTADLQRQLDHNLLVRDLVSDTNRLVAKAKADKNAELVEKLVTPPIRYSQPAFQTQVLYLYTATNSTDQIPGEDVVERYKVLRKQYEELAR